MMAATESDVVNIKIYKGNVEFYGQHGGSRDIYIAATNDEYAQQVLKKIAGQQSSLSSSTGIVNNKVLLATINENTAEKVLTGKDGLVKYLTDSQKNWIPAPELQKLCSVSPGDNPDQLVVDVLNSPDAILSKAGKSLYLQTMSDERKTEAENYLRDSFFKKLKACDGKSHMDENSLTTMQSVLEEVLKNPRTKNRAAFFALTGQSVFDSTRNATKVLAEMLGIEEDVLKSASSAYKSNHNSVEIPQDIDPSMKFNQTQEHLKKVMEALAGKTDEAALTLKAENNTPGSTIKPARGP